MKWLKRLRLINWHYFQDETLEFGPQTLISGRNSAGKSTIIDAMQVLFVANQRQIRFNSAAHDDAKRSLVSYLRGKIGSDDQKFVRDGDFTTYILSEFYDEPKKERFVVGVVMDVFRDNNVDEEYFILAGVGIDDLDLIHPSGQKGQLRNREQFRRWCGGLKGRVNFERNKGAYQEAFLTRVGHVSKRFVSIFTKALSFRPIQDVREFVYDYVLDKKALQLDVMRENFEIHERYRRELDDLLKRKNQLEKIVAQFENYAKLRDTVDTQEYVIRRLQHAQQAESLENVDCEIAQLREDIDRLEADLRLNGAQLAEAQDRVPVAYRNWQEHGVHKKEQELKEEIRKTNQEIREKSQLLEAMKGFLRRERALLEDLAQWEGDEHWQWAPEGDERERLREAIDLLASLPPQSSREAEAQEEAFRDVGLFLSDLHSRFTKALGRIEDRLKALDGERDELKRQINDLEKKKQRVYEKEVLNLKALLEERLRGRSPVWIFCEEMEIDERDEEWRNAVEGYLNTQRFDLLVRPEVFAEALSIYEREKRRHAVEGVGLVDTGKEARFRGSAQAGSLAMVLKTDNPIIQARIDHLLGRVMQAENEQDLRRHAVAVTRSCMSYHNLVARQIPEKRYAVPYIGARAILRQLEIKRQELAQLEERRTALAKRKAAVEGWTRNLAERASRYAQMAPDLTLPAVIAALEQHREDKQGELARLDKSEVERLKDEYDFWRKRQDELTDEGRKLDSHKTVKDNRLKECLGEQYVLQNRVREAEEHWRAWNLAYPAELLPRAEERWREAERSGQATATKLSNLITNQKGNANKRDQEFQTLRDFRKDYNKEYNYNADVEGRDNREYQPLLTEIASVDIPAYQTKLQEALAQSEEEFKSHFIFKMREAIHSAKREFGELNHALRHFPFSEDHYRFEIKASERYKRFYDVIMDPNVGERGSLFDLDQEDKAAALHELFERLIRGDIGDQEEFTDYRRYLDFDIAVESRGNRYMFSQVLREKSGGETQTPFYITILASFYQLYGSNKTMRLVVFDEAFNKMDEERIQTSLRLIKRLNLQLIAAVPDEKMQHMAPEVTTTLIVHRDGYTCFVDLIDKAEASGVVEGLGGGSERNRPSEERVEGNGEGEAPVFDSKPQKVRREAQSGKQQVPAQDTLFALEKV
ncbi:AAA family ATPase [Heliobacterium undosum]|uniref:AAA family ATPase n=1 Tax=Heliomicrobium undosum TaxID=121734 RepID=A0A845L609_9FIRM|nr:SbcC/MukB-like Walker B domain-containing protein [Heliomicrobium undosum]MZP30659.1 AAA family ATPase [Heliomicrobium undosum]